jgi:hypothetical protein
MPAIYLFRGLSLVLVPIGFHCNVLLVFSYHPSASRDRAELVVVVVVVVVVVIYDYDRKPAQPFPLK